MRVTRDISAVAKGARGRLLAGSKVSPKPVVMSISAHRVRNMGARKNAAPMKAGTHK